MSVQREIRGFSEEKKKAPFFTGFLIKNQVVQTAKVAGEPWMGDVKWV